MHDKKWVAREYDTAVAAGLTRELGVSPALGRILAARGFSDVDAARRYLAPDHKDAHDSFGFQSMTHAVKRIVQAIRNGDRIVIYGDYDVDGATSSALLYSLFRYVEADVGWFIPNRLTDGYGLSLATVEKVIADGAKLIITCDCGVTSVDEIARAGALGVDVIVCDHHEAPETLPPAFALINPKLEGEDYPNRDLAAVGVAYKLACALIFQLGLDRDATPQFDAVLQHMLALVAIGTVADVVPLVGENRLLVRLGCKALETSAHPGIKALKEVSHIKDGPVEAWHIGYQMGPRLNAGGRMGDSSLAFGVLTSDSYSAALAIAQKLDTENSERRTIEQEVQQQARNQYDTQYGSATPQGIVLAQAGWHKGVIGIVAQRIVDLHYRPTAILCCDGDRARASLRSIPGVNVTDVLSDCEDLLHGYGGHAAAAGLEMDTDNIEEFRTRFDAAVKQRVDADMLTPKLHIDVDDSLAELSLDLARHVEQMAPFGRSNPRPLFASHGLEVVGQPRTMGNTSQHLQFIARQNGTTYRVVAFGFGHRIDEVSRGTRLSVAYRLKINTWRTDPELELEAQDIKVDAP